MNKMFATIKAVDPDKGGPGEFEAILSMPTVDRDGEVIDAKAFEPLPARINIDVDHAMTVEKTVGSGVPFYDGDVLKIKGTFASTQLGQDVRTLVNEGHIDSLSVAYMNAVYEKEKGTGVPHVRKAELLNAGIVGIPANREAIITMSKSYAESAIELAQAVTPELAETQSNAEKVADAIREVGAKAGARHSTQDAGHIQAAHDALAALGAACATKSPEASGETTTDTDAKAPSDPVATATPSEPAGSRVDVAAVKALALAAEAALL